MKISKSYRSTLSTPIAYFISPHGFGHAARAAAVIEALHRVNPAFSFDLFTTVPVWFFEDSLTAPFIYHRVKTDLGLVQRSPFQEDIHETLRRLDTFLPFDPSLIDHLAQTVARQHSALILCDISPLGLAVSRVAKIPSILIENFTWDWIYQGYADVAESMKKHIRYLRPLFASADYRVQTEPVCQRRPADLTTLPVSRKFRAPAGEIRRQLQLPDDRKMVLITTGGIPGRHKFLSRLAGLTKVAFVMPGAGRTTEIRENVILMPHRSDMYHPDLVNASDAVVGKTGYSTLAEIYAAGVPFGFVSSPDFRESGKLNAYIQREMSGIKIGVDPFEDGSWLSLVPELLELSRNQPRGLNGADQIAEFICKLTGIGDKNIGWQEI